MKIETIFNPGDQVWVIYENKASKFPIHSIKTEASILQVDVQYFINVGTEKNYQCKIFYEGQCFKSREDLINSL